MAEERSTGPGEPGKDAEAQPGNAEEPTAGGEQQAASSEPGERGRSASDDLADGLELMLRAARKAMRGIDPGRIEALGRRAVSSVENLDRRTVGELGRKAARNLDPRRIEEIAEDAGRELLGVVERVADRVESAVSGAQRASRASAGQEPGDAESSAGDEPAERGDEPRSRVRVDDSEK